MLFRPALGQGKALPLQFLPLGGQLLPLVFQLGITGQIRLEQGDLLGQLLPLGLFLQFPGPGLLRLGQESSSLPKLPLQLRQGLPAALLLLGLGQPGVDGLQLLVQLVQPGLQPGGAAGIRLQHPGDEGGGVLHGQLSRLGQAKLGGQLAALVPLHPGQVLPQAFPGILTPAIQGGGLPFQALLQALVQVGFENLPENLLPILGGGQQKLEEVPLGDHGNLHELVPIQPQDVPNGGIHLFGPGDGLAVLGEQPGLRLLLGGAGAVELGPLVFRHPMDGIALLPA